MGGVAGKSEGCTTCRRRKIKVCRFGHPTLACSVSADTISQCDCQKPTCRNCTRSKRVCEGYERYPVFINRTNAGLQKRKPLEEAKPTSAESATAKQPSGDLAQSELRSSAGEHPFRFSSGDVESTIFISWYWDFLAPSRSVKSSLQGRLSHWLYHIITISSPQSALGHSLLAIAVTRCGMTHRDPILLNQGQKLYTSSLGLLQHTLNNPELAIRDETLATVCILMLYEVWCLSPNRECPLIDSSLDLRPRLQMVRRITFLELQAY